MQTHRWARTHMGENGRLLVHAIYQLNRNTHTHISYQSNVDVRAHTGERWMEYETIILNIQFVFEFQY